MELAQHLFVCALLTLCATPSANGKNILVWYAEASHWINMRPLLESLVDRGHQVTVLTPNTTMHMNTGPSSRFKYEHFDVAMSLEEMESYLDGILNFFMFEVYELSYWQIFQGFKDRLVNYVQLCLTYLDGVVKSETLMTKLKEENYDLLLSDPFLIGSDLLADILDVPLVYSLRFSMANNWERCGQLPSPRSYVPGAMSKLTDKMNFSQRIANFVFYTMVDLFQHNIRWSQIDRYYSEIKGTPTSGCELMGKADFWLIRTYWDFDFPRPFLPNFKYVGGIHCRPAKPLPEEMEAFVQSSGDAGVIVFTLGSMIKNITLEKANMIASDLAQIPQKVLWRYTGEKPATLGENTRIYDWLPQNDLLGHPKTRVFITHGGTNGIYEAIYHGVPMVGIPIFADQPDNVIHLKAKGAAVSVDFHSMRAGDLRDAISTVINDKSYKEAAMRLSRIHHDRPMSPLDEALFWIEFTMRNKGAKHLRVQSHDLTWYQYHCLDVLAFLLAIVLLFTLIFITTCKLCYRMCCSTKGKKKME